MAIVLGLVIAVVVAAVAAVVVSSTRRQLGAQEAAAAAARDEAAAALAAVTAERDEMRTSRDWFEASAGRANLEVERQRDRADDLTTKLAEASAAAAASAVDGDGGDGLWLLLLAHVARRWGAMVGVPPEGRAVVSGPPADQLAEALAREIERLREEVGVDVEMAAAPAAGAEGEGGARLGDDPADRVPALLAALELLGVLTATSEQVTVALGDELVLTGDGWFDPAGELAAARDRAAAAGATVGPVTASGEQVEVVLRRSGVSARP